MGGIGYNVDIGAYNVGPVLIARIANCEFF